MRPKQLSSSPPTYAQPRPTPTPNHTPESQVSVLNGGEGSLLRNIARETGAELSLKKDRDPTVVLVTGQPASVAAARDRLVKYLDGDDNGTVVLMEVSVVVVGRGEGSGRSAPPQPPHPTPEPIHPHPPSPP